MLAAKAMKLSKRLCPGLPLANMDKQLVVVQQSISLDARRARIHPPTSTFASTSADADASTSTPTINHGTATNGNGNSNNNNNNNLKATRPQTRTNAKLARDRR